MLVQWVVELPHRVLGPRFDSQLGLLSLVENFEGGHFLQYYIFQSVQLITGCKAKADNY